MIKDIVVHLTGSEEDRIRLAYAEPIAAMFDAHLTGLLVHMLPEVIAITDPSGSSFLQTLLEESVERAHKATAALAQTFSSFVVPHDLRRLDVYAATAGKELAAAARTADLFIGTRPYGDPSRQQRIEEAVLFKSGRACLFLPPGGKPGLPLDTIFVAWKNTREAARVVAESIPFLQQAKEVVVGLVEEGGASEQDGIVHGANIARHLSRHGISAELRTINGWADAGEAILNEAKRTAADMIVMGGYGHSRYLEWAVGGATRRVLSEAPIPVLIAH